MPSILDKKRLLIFLAFAFGIAWAGALVIALTGGIAGSRPLVPGSNYTYAVVLMATVYMGAPAIAHVLTRLITHEGWQNVGLRPQLRRGWPYWLATWVLPAVLTILGAAVYFVCFPAKFDPQLTTVQSMLKQSGAAGTAITPALLILIQTLQAIIIAPLVNSLFTFGEEFGWRAYLLPKLLPVGEKRAILLTGLIWGVWHWPVIAMGHNYGLEYPGFPWLGMLLMVLFCVSTGAFLGWATLRGGSVWPAVIGHAAINGISAIGALAVLGDIDPLLGPLPVALIGMTGWLLVAAWIFLSKKSVPG
jgi:membrane protease YdiL (CAAX protease family)